MSLRGLGFFTHEKGYSVVVLLHSDDLPHHVHHVYSADIHTVNSYTRTQILIKQTVEVHGHGVTYHEE